MLVINGFDPIVGDVPIVLILGSMPSVTSLDKQEYYGFKYNRFWSIMAEYLNRSFLSYEDKVKALQQHHIALWDVIASCEREGSLDSKIRNEQINPIDTFLCEHPSIQMVICNGKKSYELYKKHIHSDITCVCLPSTSNANRSIKEQDLFTLWLQALSKKVNH